MLSVKIKSISFVISFITLFSFTACSSETTNKVVLDSTNEEFVESVVENKEVLNTIEQTTPNIADEETILNIHKSEDISVTSESGVGGNLPPCEHCVILENGTIIDASYHQFSGKLIEYIGYEAFQEWTENYSDPEDINILTYIKDNDVPREYIDEINSMYGSVYYFYDYNTEALYGDDAEGYYTSDRVEETLMRAYLLNFKSGLSAWIKKSNSYEDWIAAKDSVSLSRNSTTFDGDMRRWSISEVISDFNISRDVIADLAERASVSTMGLCEIDIDALYDLSVIEMESSGVNGVDLVINNTEDMPSDESLVSFDFSKYIESEEMLAEGFEYNP